VHAAFLGAAERQHILAGLGFPGEVAFADGDLITESGERALVGDGARGQRRAKGLQRAIDPVRRDIGSAQRTCGAHHEQILK